MLPAPAPYRGRFAPSPTGPLHFGSLVAAVGSYLDARAHRGEWLVRIEDLDPPRTRPGAADCILAQLEAYGFEWDGPVLHQSSRFEAYGEAIARLAREGALRECSCSRSALAALPQNAARPAGTGEELFHPADCLPVNPTSALGHALRLRVPAGPVRFDDRSLGPQCVDVSASVGDFVLQRRDGLFAYQLAVVVDDATQGITDVVRGYDLLSSTARQVLLQRALIDGFSRWGGVTALGSANLEVPADVRLSGRIEQFQLDLRTTPTVRIAVQALLLKSRGGGIVASRRIESSVAAVSARPDDVARAFSKAQDALVREAYSWAAAVKP